MEHSPLALIYNLTAEVITSVANSHHFSGEADMIHGLGGNRNRWKKVEYNHQFFYHEIHKNTRKVKEIALMFMFCGIHDTN